MILIIGASGAVGKPLIKELVTRGEDIRAMTSSEASEAKLKALGVTETVLGDYRVDGDLARAFAGMSNVCYIPARFKEDEFKVGRNIVDAARSAGIDHFLFCSAYHPQMQSLGHHWQKLQLEEYLINSDLKYTVVQPSMFMQNIRVEWPKVSGEGIYARPYSPDSPMNVIDTADLAGAMANILTKPEFQGATYELCGRDLISHAEMALILSEELGRPVEAVHRDLEEWKTWAKERGWTDYAITTYAAMCHHYDTHGYKHGNDITLCALIGRPTTDYRSFVKRFIGEMAG